MKHEYNYAARYVTGGKPFGKGANALVVITATTGFIAVWAFISSTLPASWSIFPGPRDVASSLWAMLFSSPYGGSFGVHVRESVLRVLSGVALGLVGYPLGVALVLFRPLRPVGALAVPLVISVSKVGVYYLFIVAFGVYDWSKISLSAWATFVFLLWHSYHEALSFVEAPRQSTRSAVIETAVNWGVGRSMFFLFVLLPRCLPGFFRGLRYALTTSWMLLALTEATGATRGLGHLVYLSYYNTDIPGLFASVLLLMVVSATSWKLVSIPESSLERRYGGTSAGL